MSKTKKPRKSTGNVVQFRSKTKRRSKPAGTAFDVREQVIETARRIFKSFSPLMAESAGTCVYKAAAMVGAGQYHGMTLLPQAGSAFWRRIPKSEDDGTQDTHWGFQFDSETALEKGDLPLEVHVWVACVETQEIIDSSTGDWVRSCKEIGGLDWPADPPPDYIWRRFDNPIEDAMYVPDDEATKCACNAIEQIWDAWGKGLQFIPPGWGAPDKTAEDKLDE